MMQHYLRYLVRLIPTLKPWSHWYLPVIYSYGLYFTKHCKLSNQIQSYPCRQIIMYLSFQFPLNLIILFFFILKLDLHDVIQILLVCVVMAGFFWRGWGGRLNSSGISHCYYFIFLTFLESPDTVNGLDIMLTCTQVNNNSTEEIRCTWFTQKDDCTERGKYDLENLFWR